MTRPVVVRAGTGIITITQPPEHNVHIELASWEVQLKEAIRKGGKPESDYFEGMKIRSIQNNGHMKQRIKQ